MENVEKIKTNIIKRFGGPSAVARICGVTPSAVSQWHDIPAEHQRTLYNYAKKEALPGCKPFRLEEFYEE